MNIPETRIMFSKFNQYCNMYTKHDWFLLFRNGSQYYYLNIFLYNKVFTNYLKVHNIQHIQNTRKKKSKKIYMLFCKQQTLLNRQVF